MNLLHPLLCTLLLCSVSVVWCQPGGSGVGAVAPSTIALLSDAYSVNAPDYVARISIARMGSKVGNASIAYTTSDYSAKAGQHYLNETGKITWPDGDNNNKIVQVRVLQSRMNGANAQFFFHLSAPFNAFLGVPYSAVVYINNGVNLNPSVQSADVVNNLPPEPPLLSSSSSSSSSTGVRSSSSSSSTGRSSSSSTRSSTGSSSSRSSSSTGYSSSSTGYSSSSSSTGTVKPAEDVECYTDSLGADYTGHVSVSKQGLRCITWPASIKQQFPNASLDENYCRNPSKAASPW